ncbi:MAG: HK97 family phage prohead protease [Propionivibrio sp.]|uniref:HK97 family phage prohead protease n=1 Tax=Propionivibrio sp. TaxID=2212460 RepID=UPI0025D33B2C|nr:HK97 family phage prohead protease [Propionivibrio sp.]MBL0209285.1 HK97 family phage prohead protease [Propionivibrio sp.]
MLTHQTLSLSECDIKFAASEGTFSGYGSVFGNVDSKNDIVAPGAYAEVLKSGEKIPVYVNHGWLDGKLPVGSWSGLKEDDRGLFGEAGLVMQMPSAIDAYWGMKSGLVTGLSVAFLPDGKSIERRSDGVRVIHKVKMLKEISIVNEPANEEARVFSVKATEEIGRLETVRDFERLLRDVGSFDQATAKQLVAKAKDIFKQRDADEDAEAQSSQEQLLFALRNYLPK